MGTRQALLVFHLLVHGVNAWGSAAVYQFSNHKAMIMSAGDVGNEGGLGDISGGLETTMEYLPTFTPMERIAITATGNLQRIFSSYYNSPVTVSCIRNEEVC